MRETFAALWMLVTFLSPATAQWGFTEVGASAGLAGEHGIQGGLLVNEALHMAGGIAAGDYDRNGTIDLYAVRGNIGPNLLFRNEGDGTFKEVAGFGGVGLQSPAGTSSSAPLFCDLDGDGWLDLFVGAVQGGPPALFRNDRDGTFTNVFAKSGIAVTRDTFSAACGDYDRDGDLDLFLAHWGALLGGTGSTTESLWRNDGNLTFTDVSVASGITAAFLAHPNGGTVEWAFTGNFTDVDEDGWVDILVAADFGTSMVLHNRTDGTFEDLTDPQVITDENGMGAAVGDYDGDGHIDWFVSSIWDPNGVAEGTWGVTGNRLYRGLGDGTFVDVTDAAGVRNGYWGWGATFADLDNDRDLDLIHTNGFGDASVPNTAEYLADPTRLFVSDGAGIFTEEAVARSLVDSGLGRGIVAFDYDDDGDLDLAISNANGPLALFRNDGGNLNGSLTVRLHGTTPNIDGIGARVTLTTGAVTQVREIRGGSNFESQNPAEAHFGTGTAPLADAITIRWPRGAVTTLTDVPTGQRIVVAEPSATCAADQVCDVCGLSALVRLRKAKVKIRGLATPAADDTIAFAGTWIGRTDTPITFDPVANGIEFSIVRDAAPGSPVFAVALPPGAYDPALGAGWRANARGTVYTYQSDVGVGGITKAVIRRSRRTPTRLRAKIRGRQGAFPIDPADLPLRAIVTLDPSAAPTLCVEARFSGTLPPHGCEMLVAGAVVKCR